MTKFSDGNERGRQSLRIYSRTSANRFFDDEPISQRQPKSFSELRDDLMLKTLLRLAVKKTPGAPKHLVDSIRSGIGK